ncbi:pyrroline-5-carboxylate reductase [Bifidobacterium gallicum]|uniref:Pyrroline-5-carboxylate reductase n=1 Tax=Bifidobacterium gallicum DSM 20093 = LMG 11596 TaxID=561180 RepID=D1NS09_9BIFI|nr:pyrroline-5-carboxylate reductase [Bifidobacterium gallicum]EFA23461.1 pyrroline-5-carboxylate reductase [Bifidobacterium gallicum DSM 20093 = LMG 11596]KFI57251.1 pyrroline-5-carboxylate reductase [Bifidobacterium gallicum DSM 20093 = LMG 11596]
MSDFTVGFIGFGNMAQAITKGLIEAGVVTGEQIIACAAHFDRLERNAAKYGVKAVQTAEEVADAAKMIIVAIKPYQIASVLQPMTDLLADRDSFIVSIAAGWTLADYEHLFGDKHEHIHVQCTIPNTPMAVGKGVLVTEAVHTLKDDQRVLFEQLLGSISLVERVNTEHMGIGMCIAGCAPAFTDMYLEALGDAGVKYGLPRATAYRLAAKMIEGVGALYLASDQHPGAMKDAVCSPGGTTIKGVASLEESAFRGEVIKAIDAIEQ